MGWEKEPPQQRIGKSDDWWLMQASQRQSGIGQLGTEEAMPSHGQGLPAWVLFSASQFAASGLQQGCSLWGGSAPCIIEIGQVKSRIKIIVYLLSCPLGSLILKGTHRQSLCPQQGEDLCRSSALEEEELLEGLATPPWIGGQDNVQGLWRGWWLHLWRKAGVKDNREPMLGRGRSPHERKGLQAPGPDLFGELGCDLLWVMLQLSYLVVQSSTLVLPLATTS